MSLLEDLDNFLGLAFAPVGYVSRPVVAVSMPAVAPREGPPQRKSGRVVACWPTCLACDVGKVEAGTRGQYSGLCDACYVVTSKQSRIWYRKLVERWRKWSATRAHREAFDNEPTPWQLILFSFGTVMVGFETAPGTTAERVCLDKLVDMSASELMEVCRGRAPLPQLARDKLAQSGVAWLKFWRVDEDGDE